MEVFLIILLIVMIVVDMIVNLRLSRSRKALDSLTNRRIDMMHKFFSEAIDKLEEYARKIQ